MDMYQKRKMRKEKNSNEQEKSCASMNINWFPGHMAKTRRQIEEDLGFVDIVVELLDARIPISSQNPDLRAILGKNGNKKIKFVILNKSDLADPKETAKWIEYFKKQNTIAIEVDSNTGRGINESIRKIEKEMQEVLEKSAQKGRIGRKIRAMVVGIPNVGKSSFINRIAKKNTAEVGNKPGVTKKKQWIRINENIELLDTPGVLWPKFENQEVALNLSFTGTIKDDILDKVEVAYQLIKYMLENYRNTIVERYNISDTVIEEILNREELENVNIYEIMQMIGKSRGAIKQGAEVDDEKTARLILDDFRSGKLGKITIEKVI